MSNDGPERRLRRIERAMPPPPCPQCRGHDWHVVMGDAPMPPPVCPTCKREIHVVHIVGHDEETGIA